MRVNIYAEEMPDEPRIEIITKEIEGHAFTGLRIYLELPATVDGQQYQGPFIHRPGDDDSAAVTFWGKRDLRVTLRRALELLDAHYDGRPAPSGLGQTVADAIRLYCSRFGTHTVAMSSDGIERIYHVGLSVDALSAAIVRALGERCGASS